MDVMKAISSARHVLSGNCRMNLGSDRISSGGSKTSTPHLVRCCRRIDCGGVLYGVENNVDIRISHHRPLFHNPLFEVSDGRPQCVFLIFMYQFREVVEDVIYLVYILLGFFWIFVLQRQATLPLPHQVKSITGGASFEAISSMMYWILT